MDNSMELVDRIMGALFNSEEWNHITTKDPNICAKLDRIDKIMEQLQSMIPYELYSDLEDAIGHAETAYSDAGILFGMHVAETLRQVAANSTVYSAYSLRKSIEREATA